MRELVYYVAASIDGYIAGPEGQFDAFPIEGDHNEILTTRFADAIPTAIATHLGIAQPGTTFGAVVMGWNTYAVGLEDGVTSPYFHLQQIVFSRTRQGNAENLSITSDDPVKVVRSLKQKPGANIWLCGGGNLASHLRDEIDRIIIKRNPLLFGDGVPIFGRSDYAPESLHAVNSQAFQSGVVVTEYLRSR